MTKISSRCVLLCGSIDQGYCNRLSLLTASSPAKKGHKPIAVQQPMNYTASRVNTSEQNCLQDKKLFEISAVSFDDISCEKTQRAICVLMWLWCFIYVLSMYYNQDTRKTILQNDTLTFIYVISMYYVCIGVRRGSAPQTRGEVSALDFWTTILFPAAFVKLFRTYCKSHGDAYAKPFAKRFLKWHAQNMCFFTGWPRLKKAHIFSDKAALICGTAAPAPAWECCFKSISFPYGLILAAKCGIIQ